MLLSNPPAWYMHKSSGQGRTARVVVGRQSWPPQRRGDVRALDRMIPLSWRPPVWRVLALLSATCARERERMIPVVAATDIMTRFSSHAGVVVLYTRPPTRGEGCMHACMHAYLHTPLGRPCGCGVEPICGDGNMDLGANVSHEPPVTYIPRYGLYIQESTMVIFSEALFAMILQPCSGAQ